MNSEDVRSYDQTKLAMRVVRGAGKLLSKVPDADAGISPRDAFVLAFDNMTSRQVRDLLAQNGDVEISGILKTGYAAGLKLGGGEVGGVPPDVLAEALAKTLVDAGRVRGDSIPKLREVLKRLLVAGVSIYRVLTIIQDWLAGSALDQAIQAAGLNPKELGITG